MTTTSRPSAAEYFEEVGLAVAPKAGIVVTLLLIAGPVDLLLLPFWWSLPERLKKPARGIQTAARNTAEHKDTLFDTCEATGIAHIECCMSTDPTTSDGPFAPHCGSCEHVHFRDDWNRTPYCSYHDRETEIRVGDVCSQFNEQSDDGRASEQNDHAADVGSVEIVEDEQLRGLTGPFYAVYDDEHKQGWYCSNCGALGVAADPMGRLKCNTCGNIHQSNEWDAGYL